jgi:hypothetical protein
MEPGKYPGSILFGNLRKKFKDILCLGTPKNFNIF